MQLSRRQRTVLKRYQDFHIVPPTLMKLIEISLAHHIVRLMIFGAIIAMAATTFGDISVVLFFVGLLVGSLGRDVAQFRATVQLWPLLDRFLDWSKIESSLEKDEVPEA